MPKRLPPGALAKAQDLKAKGASVADAAAAAGVSQSSLKRARSAAKATSPKAPTSRTVAELERAIVALDALLEDDDLNARDRVQCLTERRRTVQALAAAEALSGTSPEARARASAEARALRDDLMRRYGGATAGTLGPTGTTDHATDIVVVDDQDAATGSDRR